MEEQAIELPPLPDAAWKDPVRSYPRETREWYTADQMQAYARAAVLAERERCAKVCELSADAIRLIAGEMTAQEMRSVRAVLASRAAAIRKG